jgi:hypothetical protein
MVGACTVDRGGSAPGTPRLVYEGRIKEVDPQQGPPTSFTIRSGGNVRRVFIDLDRDYGFDLGHLRVHLREAEPVRVILERRSGKLFARAIEDA